MAFFANKRIIVLKMVAYVSISSCKFYQLSSQTLTYISGKKVNNNPTKIISRQGHASINMR